VKESRHAQLLCLALWPQCLMVLDLVVVFQSLLSKWLTMTQKKIKGRDIIGEWVTIFHGSWLCKLPSWILFSVLLLIPLPSLERKVKKERITEKLPVSFVVWIRMISKDKPKTDSLFTGELIITCGIISFISTVWNKKMKLSLMVLNLIFSRKSNQIMRILVGSQSINASRLKNKSTKTLILKFKPELVFAWTNLRSLMSF